MIFYQFFKSMLNAAVPILWYSSGSCTSTLSLWKKWYSACSHTGGIRLNCLATEYASYRQKGTKSKTWGEKNNIFIVLLLWECLIQKSVSDEYYYFFTSLKKGIVCVEILLLNNQNKIHLKVSIINDSSIF